MKQEVEQEMEQEMKEEVIEDIMSLNEEVEELETIISRTQYQLQQLSKYN